MKRMTTQLTAALLSILFVLSAHAAPSRSTGETSPPSDTWLQTKLIAAYTFNRHLNPLDISVDVNNQVADLSGMVASDIDRDLAGEIARSIDGIKSVNNNLVVDERKADEARVKRATSKDYALGRKIEDLTTTAVIKTKLIADQNVPGLTINVDTKNGRVTLGGKVETEKQRDLIELIAKNTSGVADVENHIKVAM